MQNLRSSCPPAPARDWLEELRSSNVAWWAAGGAPSSRRPRLHRPETASADRLAWDGAVEDCIFAYAGIKRTSAHDGSLVSPADADIDKGFHVDGGPSLVFLSLTLYGERVVEIERDDGSRARFHVRPGDWCITSPSSFWHCVLAVPGGEQESVTLLLRSAVLVKRRSGGGH